jgi:hypothetical protein
MHRTRRLRGPLTVIASLRHCVIASLRHGKNEFLSQEMSLKGGHRFDLDLELGEGEP